MKPFAPAVAIAALTLTASTVSANVLVGWGDRELGDPTQMSAWQPGFSSTGAFAGAFEDNHYNPGLTNKRIWGTGVGFTPNADGPLSTASAALDVANSGGVRLEVFELPDPMPTTQGWNWDWNAPTTLLDHTSLTLVDHATATPGNGKQWVDFDFAADGTVALLDDDKGYIAMMTVTDTHTGPRNQSHYWLGKHGTHNGATLFQFNTWHGENTAVPVGAWGDTSFQGSWAPSLVVDTTPIPEPTAALAITGLALLGLRRR